MKDQIQIFKEYEGDAWFDRNKEAILSYDEKNDFILQMIKRYNLKPISVLEIGCSAGHRLNALRNYFNGVSIQGIDPSEKAIRFSIENGKFASGELILGTSDDLSCFKNGSFDLVIVGFVFYVVDRSMILKSISEIDRVLKNDGVLIISDFFASMPARNEYHHVKNQDMHSYKLEYEKIFASTFCYHLIAKDTLHHSKNEYICESDFKNYYSVSMLKKSLFNGYGL